MSQVPGRVVLLAVTLLVSLVGSGGVASAETIQGHVLNPDGTPVTDEAICVRASDAPDGTGSSAGSSPSAGGAYSVDVSPGTWYLTFRDCPEWGLSRNDAPTYHGPTGRRVDAVTLTVTAGHDVTGIDQRLRPGATIGGHVYGGAGTTTPLASVCLNLFPVDGPSLSSTVSQSWSDSDGSYLFSRLDPDFHYKMKATPCPTPGYVGQWYDGVATQAEATSLSAPVSGVDIHLASTTPDPPADDDPPAEDPGTGAPTDGGGTPTDTGTQKTDTGNGPPPAVVTPPSVSAPAPIVPAPLVAQSRPAARAAFGAFGTQRLGAALRSGLRLPLRCAAACSAKASVSVSAATAKRLNLPRSLTTVRAKLKAGTPTVLVVGLPAAARRAFAHERRATFAVTVTAAGTTLRRTLSLKR